MSHCFFLFLACAFGIHCSGNIRLLNFNCFSGLLTVVEILDLDFSFENIAAKEEEDGAELEEEEGPLAAVSGDSVEDLEALLVNLFKEADVDGSGYLSAR